MLARWGPLMTPGFQVQSELICIQSRICDHQQTWAHLVPLYYYTLDYKKNIINQRGVCTAGQKSKQYPKEGSLCFEEEFIIRFIQKYATLSRETSSRRS